MKADPSPSCRRVAENSYFYQEDDVTKPEQEPNEERQLIEQAKKGDRRAFSVLVKRLEDVVYRYAFRLCRDEQKAEETLQDTFVNMYRKLHQFDGRARLSTWLYRIATNSCLMKHRGTKSQKSAVSIEEVSERLHDKSPSPLASLEKKELSAVLDGAIGKLPAANRIVFVMRDLEGLTAEETARILKISVEATKSRLRRARAALRENLEPYIAS
jgi:RNA polymerase sigma-70 factor (ECF subfamily)